MPAVCPTHGSWDPRIYADCPDCQAAERVPRPDPFAAAAAFVPVAPAVRPRRAYEREKLGVARGVLAFFGYPSVLDLESDRVPWLTWSVVAALVAIHALGAALFGDDSVGWMAYPAWDVALWRIPVASVSHANLSHLIGNAWFTLAFGAAVESKVPRLAMLAAALCIGVVSIFAQSLLMSPGQLILGFSGATAGLLGAALFLQPWATVTLWVFRVPMLVYVALFVVVQSLGAYGGSGGVAFVAHLVGLVLGLIGGRVANALWP